MAVLLDDVGSAKPRVALAAIRHQKIDQPADAAIIGGVENVTAFFPRIDQPGIGHLLQVKGHGWRGKTQCFAECARGDAARAGPHQQPQGVQPGLLGERRKDRKGIFCFHISIIIEI